MPRPILHVGVRQLRQYLTEFALNAVECRLCAAKRLRHRWAESRPDEDRPRPVGW